MDRIEQGELERSDGKEGRRALVAHEGKVYDVSESGLWPEGAHMNTHEAGNDLTAAIVLAPHEADVLERVTLVGELAEPDEAPEISEFPTPPKPIALLLDRHPHPISVHFPIALSITAALFTALSLATRNPLLEEAAFLNLCVAALASPVAIMAGLLSWRYNYGQVLTPIFRNKLLLSVGLLVVLALILCLQVTAMPTVMEGGAVLYVYSALVLLAAPVVMALGFFGGKITFPS